MELLALQLQLARMTLSLLLLQTQLQAPATMLRTPVEETIVRYADQYGVDKDLALAIVRCESNFDRFAKNPGSTAESYYQFLNSTWKNTMRRMNLPTTTAKTDPEISIKAGVWLLAQDGTVHWTESKPCWNKKTPLPVPN